MHAEYYKQKNTFDLGITPTTLRYLGRRFTLELLMTIPTLRTFFHL